MKRYKLFFVCRVHLAPGRLLQHHRMDEEQHELLVVADPVLAFVAASVPEPASAQHLVDVGRDFGPDVRQHRLDVKPGRTSQDKMGHMNTKLNRGSRTRGICD